MNNLLNNARIWKLSKSLMIVMIFISLSSCSVIGDNAVNLAYDLEAAAQNLKSQKIGSEFVIHFEPVDIEAPSYIDLKDGATLIVYQNGSISFTTYYRQFVDVKTTQVINGIGVTDILVKTIGVRPGNLSDQVLIIELQ